jgi:hypothetical protein
MSLYSLVYWHLLLYSYKLFHHNCICARHCVESLVKLIINEDIGIALLSTHIAFVYLFVILDLFERLNIVISSLLTTI